MPPEEDGTTTEETQDTISDDQLSELLGGMETRIAERLEERLGDRFDSVADRRVNALLKEIRERQPAPTPKKDGEREDPPPPARSDDRTDRLLAKSAIQNELVLRGLTKAEAEQTQKLAFELIEGRSIGDDPFEVARQAVDRATETLASARQSAQEELRAQLKARGVDLDDEEEKPGRKPRTQETGTKVALDKGAERARSMGYGPTEED